MKNSGIKAVNNDDIVDLLESLGVYGEVIAGKKKCIFCGKTITVENIDAILPVDNSVEFSCNAEECHINLITKIGGKT
ncbi:hypothetical protein [Lacrimispora sp.]|uniref:hypothetical protein n=1 Tax=Lacrimispora sp. TaxID=2719234 RepID=UPI0029E5F61A|nr:hypothetical protein [Lacrimispora sp.]